MSLENKIAKEYSSDFYNMDLGVDLEGILATVGQGYEVDIETDEDDVDYYIVIDGNDYDYVDEDERNCDYETILKVIAKYNKDVKNFNYE